MKLLREGFGSGWYFEIRTYRNFAHRAHLLAHGAYRRSDGKSAFLVLQPTWKGQQTKLLSEQLAEHGMHMAELIDDVLR